MKTVYREMLIMTKCGGGIKKESEIAWVCVSAEGERRVQDFQMRGNSMLEEIYTVWHWQSISEKNNRKSHQEGDVGVGWLEDTYRLTEQQNNAM